MLLMDKRLLAFSAAEKSTNEGTAFTSCLDLLLLLTKFSIVSRCLNGFRVVTKVEVNSVQKSDEMFRQNVGKCENKLQLP